MAFNKLEFTGLNPEKSVIIIINTIKSNIIDDCCDQWDENENGVSWLDNEISFILEYHSIFDISIKNCRNVKEAYNYLITLDKSIIHKIYEGVVIKGGTSSSELWEVVKLKRGSYNA